MIYIQLFLSFLQIGLFSFGGGYAAMPLIQGQVVTTHQWLSMSEFTDLITISQMTPGPIAVNQNSRDRRRIRCDSRLYFTILYHCDSHCQTLSEIQKYGSFAGSFTVVKTGGRADDRIGRSIYSDHRILGKCR